MLQIGNSLRDEFNLNWFWEDVFFGNVKNEIRNKTKIFYLIKFLFDDNLGIDKLRQFPKHMILLIGQTTALIRV